MVTVGEALDVMVTISYTTILPYFDLLLPPNMELSHIVTNYTYYTKIRSLFRICEQNIIDAGFHKDKRIGYMYRTQDIGSVCQEVHGSIASMIQGGNSADFYRLYDDRDPCPIFGAAQRIRILVFAVALKQELAGFDRMQALGEASVKTTMPSLTRIAQRLHRVFMTNWYKCVPRKYVSEFSILDIKTYIANVALYYMITTFSLTDDDLKILCDTNLYAHVSKLKDSSPVCAVDISTPDLTQQLASQKALMTKLSSIVDVLVTNHNRQPHTTIKEAKIALGKAVFEMCHTLQLLCIKSINDHFGL